MNETTKSLVVLNAEQMSSTLSAIRTLYFMFGTDLAPTFEACGETEHKEILSRAHTAIGDSAKANRRNVVKAAKAAVDAVIADARREFSKATEELSKLSAATLAMMGAKLPENIKVPLSDVSDAFPQGTSKTDIVKALHEMGYVLAQGNSKAGPALLVNVKAAQ